MYLWVCFLLSFILLLLQYTSLIQTVKESIYNIHKIFIIVIDFYKINIFLDQFMQKYESNIGT